MSGSTYGNPFRDASDETVPVSEIMRDAPDPATTRDDSPVRFGPGIMIPLAAWLGATVQGVHASFPAAGIPITFLGLAFLMLLVRFSK